MQWGERERITTDQCALTSQEKHSQNGSLTEFIIINVGGMIVQKQACTTTIGELCHQ